VPTDRWDFLFDNLDLEAATGVEGGASGKRRADGADARRFRGDIAWRKKAVIG
jgi:hypothetical protein